MKNTKTVEGYLYEQGIDPCQLIEGNDKGGLYSIDLMDLMTDFAASEKAKLLEALKDLVFTASKLWDDSKPIKDTDSLTVTHPIILKAKQVIKDAE